MVARRFTVQDYYRMAEAGILAEDDRVELIEGEIIEMAPIGSRHAACVARLTRLLALGTAERAIVWVQSPLRLHELSEPQPDVSLLRPRDDFYESAHPGPDDVLLLAEVAETSATYDHSVKLPLYATAAIPEVWLIDLAAEKLEIHREPKHGKYQVIQEHGSRDVVAPSAFPDIQIEVRAVVGA